MFARASSNVTKTQLIMRTVGFILMVLGVYLIFQPIAEILSFLPFISRILKSFFLLVAILVGVLFSSITIALAWVWFHPGINAQKSASVALGVDVPVHYLLTNLLSRRGVGGLARSDGWLALGTWDWPPSPVPSESYSHVHRPCTMR